MHDWEDLSRGLTWSETEVSQGERQRLIAYRCTSSDRTRAMLECVRYLEKLLPVPKKDTLNQYSENYSSGHAIENIMNSHSQIKNTGDKEEEEENSEDDEEDEFNIHCDEGLESADVEVMTRIE
jgi:hypothetical protein